MINAMFVPVIAMPGLWELVLILIAIAPGLVILILWLTRWRKPR